MECGQLIHSPHSRGKIEQMQKKKKLFVFPLFKVNTLLFGLFNYRCYRPTVVRVSAEFLDM